MNASNVTGDSKQWEIKSTQGQWHRLAVAALLVLVAICWFLVPGGRAGAAGQGLLGRDCGPTAARGGRWGRGGSPQGSQLGFGIRHRNSAVCLGAVCRVLGMRQLSEGGISEESPSCTPQSVACRPGLGITWELVRNAGPLRRKGSATVPQAVCGWTIVLIFSSEILGRPMPGKDPRTP